MKVYMYINGGLVPMMERAMASMAVLNVIPDLVWGLGFIGVGGLGFGVVWKYLRCGVWGLGCKTQGSWFRVQGSERESKARRHSGFRVWGLRGKLAQ